MGEAEGNGLEASWTLGAVLIVSGRTEYTDPSSDENNNSPLEDDDVAHYWKSLAIIAICIIVMCAVALLAMTMLKLDSESEKSASNSNAATTSTMEMESQNTKASAHI